MAGKRWRQLTLTLNTYTGRGREKGFYQARKPAARNWPGYDRAQVHEMSDVLESIAIAVDRAYLDLGPRVRYRGPGRPRRQGAVPDLAKSVLVQQYFQLSNRRLEGCLELFSEKLGLVDVPGYKDVERAYGDLEVTVVLLGVFDLTVEAVAGERDFAVDGTGLSTSIKDNWENYLVGKRRYGVFEKLVCVVGVEHGLVSGFQVLDSMHGHESPALKPLLEDLAGRHNAVDTVCGDGAYLSRDNCTQVAALGGVPRFYPRKDSTLNSKGSKPYQDMLLSFIQDPQEWLEEYHKRCMSETVFSSLKRRFHTPLRRKIKTRRKLEVIARICVYNLTQLSYATWTKNLQTPLKTKTKK